MSKACQDSDIPSRFIRKNADISQILFIPVLIIRFISLFQSVYFHQSLKWEISLLSLKMVTEILKKTIDQSA